MLHFLILGSSFIGQLRNALECSVFIQPPEQNLAGANNNNQVASNFMLLF